MTIGKFYKILIREIYTVSIRIMEIYLYTRSLINAKMQLVS